MKALILAAGYGKRLKPITDKIPKSMVEVNGTPLLKNTLNNLVDCGINDIGIVVGHKAEYIKNAIGDSYKDARITYFENERYLTTNNVVSLYVAKQFMDDDVLLLECDIYYKKEMLEKLIQGKGDCSILVSPFNKDVMDGTVIRVSEQDKAEDLILGKWQDEDFDYSDGILTLVDVDFEEYKKRMKNRAVKKNCTIPYWMSVEADKVGINYSRVLQEAILSLIGKSAKGI